ncbi:MAG: hypothetical protein ACQETH_11620 [Candidatus Rifleibacteriota bacterium]
MSGHTQLLTLSDQTQITRYFLESYAGDVLQQITASANKLDSDNFKVFREAVRNQNLDTDFYEPSNLLIELSNELQTEIKLPPEIVFTQVEKLDYPTGYSCPNNFLGKEKRGLLEIICKAQFQDREYKLRVQYPFTVVMRLTPVIKDFVLFADQIGREQGRDKIGPDDNLNIMYTKDGEHPEIIDSEIMSIMPHRRLRPGIKYRPFIIQPAWAPAEFGNADLSGKVYLGPSDESVFLNLAGDNREIAETSMGELYLISPETFKVADENTTFEHIGVFMNQNGGFTKMLGMNIPLKHSHIAKMGVMGFSYEMVPALGTIFEGSAYEPEDFFNSGGSSSEFYQKINNYGKGFLAMASGLKLMGIKPEGGTLPAREIYGNVLSRFFVMTFWWPPSGGGEPLKYDESRGSNDFPSREVFGATTYHFEPESPDQEYQDFMSRMVSGKNWLPRSGDPPKGFLPYNIDSRITTGKQARAIFDHSNFNANDGFQAKSNLDELGKKWFGVREPGDLSLTEPTGIETRVGRVFNSGEDFLQTAGIDEGRFDVNGIVYVSGDLEVPPLTMTNDKIGGGVVLVDGTIKIANITRGYNVDTDTLNIGEVGNLYQKWSEEITQDSFLTFVSLKGEPIMIKGEALIGVQLVNLNDPFGRPYDQVIWSSSVNKEILFCGGIACNYLNLPERLREFGRIQSACNILKAPFFLYHSAMAAEEPSLAVQIMEDMRGYRLTAGKAQDE